MTTLQSQLARGTAVASSSSFVGNRSRACEGALSQAWFPGNASEQWHGSAHKLFSGFVILLFSSFDECNNSSSQKDPDFQLCLSYF